MQQKANFATVDCQSITVGHHYQNLFSSSYITWWRVAVGGRNDTSCCATQPIHGGLP